MKKNYIDKKNLLLLIFFAVLSGNTAFSQTYTFTPAGATGSVGPTQAQANSAYASTNLNGSVSVTGGIQSFTIPFGGNFRIEAWGAAGGSHPYGTGYPGGKGAYLSGDFTFTTGTVIKMIVGQKGVDTHSVTTTDWDAAGAGGGGGTFVFFGVNDPLPIMAAGGGGGGSTLANGNIHAVATTSGVAATIGAPGGVNGNGGRSNNGAGSSWWSGSGCGWITDGTGGNQAVLYNYLPGSTGAQGGRRPANGGAGGIRYNDGSDEGGDGGFGGGGGGGSDNTGSGGGGGYSGGGGAAGVTNAAGGGGGSYNSGLNPISTGSVNTGDGMVVITELCTISLTATPTNSLNPSICSGQTVTLTTNGLGSYSWSNGNTTSPSIAVAPTSTSIYTVSATYTLANTGTTCTATNSIQVIVSGGQPTLSVLTSTNQTCLGKTATLTASGAVTYTWTNGVTNGVSFFPSATTTYTVSGQNGCGIVTAVSTISVSPIAVAVVSSHSTICTNKTATLSVTALANSYTWQPGNITGTSPNLIVNPQVNTTYTIAVTDGTCTGNNTISIGALPVPTITSATSATLVCKGNTVSLTASGGINYTWTPVNQNGSSIVVSPSVSTLYNVIGDNSSGCFNTSNQVVVVGTQPTVGLTSTNYTICNGNSATLTATGGQSYQWTGGPSTNSYVVSPNVTTAYEVVGTNTSSGCTETKTINIEVFTPIVTIAGNTVICIGASASLTANGATSYTWNPGGLPFQGLSVSPASTSVYTVSAISSSNNVNCALSATVEVVVNPTPTITITSAKPAVCPKEVNTYSVSGASTFTWSNSSATLVAPTITVSSNSPTVIIYTVVGTSSLGCETSISVPANISACAGISSVAGNLSDLLIYPNPNNGDFVIQMTVEANLVLVNELGQVIRHIELNEKNHYSTCMKDLANGLYFITGTNVNRKIVVNK